MCLLMVSLGEVPNRQYLENACQNNEDGFGWAVHHGSFISTFRSMNAEETIDRYYAELSKSNSPMSMFHARFTTHGTTMVENNHPFLVDGRDDLVLAHNGMLPIVPKVGDNRSDTRIFAEDVLGAIGVEALDDRHATDALEEWMRGSKIAVFSTAPELRDAVYILNEDDGLWEGNIWWSNTGFRYAYNWRAPKPYQSMWDLGVGESESHIIGKHWWQDESEVGDVYESDLGTCMVCVQPLDERNHEVGMCFTCNSCLECMEHAEYCLCWTPASVTKSSDLVHTAEDWD